MIKFTILRYKNFLSSGNAFTTLQLDANPTTLVVGENGSGKSTMLDAITFALFGKPFRNINKPQLANSINKKECVVEIEFTIGSKDYKIVRGIRPSIFEIYINGSMIDQDAASRDYQKYLEESVLMLNFKSFTQIVILGSASFTPFMQLPLGFRREIIEDILDIQIFTQMNGILKSKMADMKEKITAIETNLTLALHKAKILQEYIKSLQNDRQERIYDLENKVKVTRDTVKEVESTISAMGDKKEFLETTIQDHSELRSERQGVLKKYDKLIMELEHLKDEIGFYHGTSECPTCKQGIDEDFKTTVLTDKNDRSETLHQTLEDIRDESAALERRMVEIQSVQAEVRELDSKISDARSEIISSERYVHTLELELHDLRSRVGNIDAEKAKLRELAKDGLQIEMEKASLNEDRHYYDLASTLLKDTGIKTKIIRQYLPAINKLVNKFLQLMDFFVYFELDEQFKENIRSRHRDDFSYSSFSEGEKQRIDLALLFTWRTIAKMKNSASTNLLILDEVFDSSLDNSGTDYVMGLLNTLGEQTNVWVISHKGDQLFDKFSNVIKFIKKRNFSVIG